MHLSLSCAIEWHRRAGKVLGGSAPLCWTFSPEVKHMISYDVLSLLRNASTPGLR